MKNANIRFLESVLLPMAGMADIDNIPVHIQKLDSNDASEVKNVIKEYLLPQFQEKSVQYQAAAKEALSYYLTTRKANFERIFDSLLLPFNPPEEAILFFIWIWEVFFPRENYQADDLSLYKETNDLNEPMRLNRPRFQNKR